MGIFTKNENKRVQLILKTKLLAFICATQSTLLRPRAFKRILLSFRRFPKQFQNFNRPACMCVHWWSSTVANKICVQNSASKRVWLETHSVGDTLAHTRAVETHISTFNCLPFRECN